MNDMEYRAFLDLMMCSDPWPVVTASEPFDTHQQMLDVANRLALDRGYSDWVDAYHRHVIERPKPAKQKIDADHIADAGKVVEQAGGFDDE